MVIPLTEQVIGLFGNTAFVPKIQNIKFLLNQRVGKIIPKTEQIGKVFLHYLLSIESVRNQIEATASGTKQRNTSPSKIYDVIVYLPEIELCQKAGELLHYFERKINLNTKINHELEEMAKTLYDYWFVQFDFPDEQGKPYRSSGGKMVFCEELNREIPEGWGVTKVKDILNVVTGKKDANFATKDGEYHFFTCGKENLKCDEYCFDGKAVLIAGNGDFNVKHYAGKFNAYQRTYVLIPREEKYVGILYIIASNLIETFKHNSNGSIVKFIKKNDVDDICIPLPNTDILFTTLNTLLDKQEHTDRETRELTTLRDWLLPMLMNGQAVVE